jgi:hypothetical protein
MAAFASIVTKPTRSEYRQRCRTAGPAILSEDEHRRVADTLRLVSADVRGIRDLLRRYPDSARCRFLAGTMLADVEALRVSMASVVGTEMPWSGVDYLADE